MNSISLHTSDDTLVPKILARETLDSDANGQIDTIFITASENLNDDFSSVNISVDGYTINSYSTNTANDTLFAIDLEEKNTADTDVTPDIQVISNSSL
ncbi:MAG: hypothetical protein GY827_03320 [Cytophagales bacterium]|nr:hypothetical protein [Cytophagales bacterium]